MEKPPYYFPVHTDWPYVCKNCIYSSTDALGIFCKLYPSYQIAPNGFCDEMKENWRYEKEDLAT